MNGRLVVFGAIVLALSALGAVYFVEFVRPERRAEPAPAPVPEVLRLSAATGSVEVAGPDGAFHPAAPGARLGEHDRIRTADDAEAELVADDGSTVKLRGGTEAEVSALRRELKRLRLGAGMVEADVKPDPSRLFEVQLDDQGAVARTRGAAFAATANGAGTSAVAARKGEVILSARGREVVIRAGEEARVQPGAPPEAPVPIPASLFLKVAWPGSTERTRDLQVSGETAPGARVRVGGHWVKVDRDGRYRAQVHLADGSHQLSVRAVDVAGHVVDQHSPRILVDTGTDFHVRPPKWK